MILKIGAMMIKRWNKRAPAQYSIGNNIPK